MSLPLDSISNLVDLLRYRAAAEPGLQIYTWLSDEQPISSLTYEQLDSRARRVAAMLISAGATKDPVLLAYPAGLEFIVGFFGCLYAGAIAVPVYPPNTSRGLDRLASIVGDCGARLGLCTEALKKRLGRTDHLPVVRWFTESDEAKEGVRQTDSTISADTIALLQYTSGSTGNPKGVIVSHHNILANERAIRHVFRQDEFSVIVSWLPMGHDMGLIGGVLQPLYAGARSRLFSPAAFVQDPARWLRVISKYQATTSGGPDFAYRLCSRKVGAEQKAGLDLSSWRVAFNGAEPVRRETIEEFSEQFRDCGFRQEAFHPCYGLAESTLLVSCNNGGSARNSAGSSQFVSCGPVVEQHELRIVDADTGQVCSEGETGEIWVSGPSVAQGYWHRPEESAATFGAQLPGSGRERFLRTGDLGFLHKGELVVAGRLKDLIIVRGQNYFPEDIEASIEQGCPELLPGSCVALAIEEAGEQRIVAVQEYFSRSSEYEFVFTAIRRAASKNHEIHLDGIVLVPRGGIPRTSSGKVRRQLCRELLQTGQIEVLAEWTSQADAEILDGEPWVTDFDSTDSVTDWIRIQLAKYTGVAAGFINLDEEMTTYGIDSLFASQLASRLETQGINLEFTTLFGGLTIRDFAKLIANSPKKSSPVQRVAAGRQEFPLSRGQYALWLNQQLDAHSSIYNLAFAARIRPSVTASSVRNACKTLAARHDILRATFPVRQGQPIHHVTDNPVEFFEQVDLRGCSPLEVEHRVAMDAHRPFDLATGPVIRVILYESQSDQSILLVAVHHIVSDFTSLALLMSELIALCGLTKPDLPPTGRPFWEYVQKEADILNEDAENRIWEFWRSELTPLPHRLELPVKPAQAADQSRQAGWVTGHVGVLSLDRLRRFSANHHTTMYATLVAVFQLLLHRYSGQTDFAIASPVSLRDPSEFQLTQGYFINPVILRVRINGDPTFTEFLDQARRNIHAVLEHRHFPFGSLVTRLQAAGSSGRSPLVEVLFTFLTATGPVSDDALFGLGVPGVKLTMGGIELENMALRPASIEFDLTFMVAGGTDGLHVALGYNQDRFSKEIAAALVRSWELLIEGVAAEPSRRISELPILSEEQIRVANEFNDTRRTFDQDLCIHQAFERKAAETPNALAVSGEGTSLTYAELNDRADRLASYLCNCGIGADDVVGVCLPRSPDLLVGLLGVLKAGAAYLPLDANYPLERIRFMLSDSGARIVVAHEALTSALQDYEGRLFRLDRDLPEHEVSPLKRRGRACHSENLAYVIYTSGSTGVPKGVMIAHRNVANFFEAMDQIIGPATAQDAWLAVSSICFDISVLELLWTVTRGVPVILDSGLSALTTVAPRDIAFSLFYFASEASEAPDARYQLLLEGAKFADENGFEAIWTPERHFHSFGGTYPNPALIGSALAVSTKRIHLRAGSVVLPLHHAVGVAEDWSVVDNLSKGRVGVSFASGWHADDFVLAPSNYGSRRDIMFRDIETVRSLWRGEQVLLTSGTGNPVSVKIYPAPLQPELPVRVTAAGTEETFRMAGEIGANVLTHLLGQSLTDVARNVGTYRVARRAAGHQGPGCVTLMLHTFVGEDTNTVREIVREPMIAYLKDSVSLIKNFARSIGKTMPEDLDSTNMRMLLEAAFERYFETSGLFGAPARCLKMVEKLKEAGADEVACLIDFGVETGMVLKSLHLLAEVQRQAKAQTVNFSQQATHLQCTPSLARPLLDREDVLGRLRCMLVGGEPLPAADAERLRKLVSGCVYNMYGPTETCVWSTSDTLSRERSDITLGRPLANTRVYVTGHHGELVPIGVPGEICIAGEGVARGYLRRPELTAGRFIPDSFSGIPGARMYCTGDRGLINHDGRLQFLGRLDGQVKLRGHRIELGEVENAISQHPAIREAAAAVQSSDELNSQLFCYVTASNAHRPSMEELREFLLKKLPEHMLPARFLWLEEMPRTPNGKLDRTRLASAGSTWACGAELPKAAANIVEEVLTAMWSSLLELDSVGTDQNFFDLGGHSLLAVQLLAMVREVFQVNIDIGLFFKSPTIIALAQKIYSLAGDRAQRSAELFKAVEQLPEAQVELMLSGLNQ